jgi:alkanesulfonate monooxygenase SsuD/methylene tetrahydromethanopterin reductase-like flavin-dependent oxidoreductase (luciferase family)
MKVGLTLWGFSVGARAAVDLAVLGEHRGFDSVFMVEGVLSNDAVTTVAGMATRTSRIVIGTGIANVYLRHPVMLAIAAATIADLSGGRLVLGLGPNNAQMIASDAAAAMSALSDRLLDEVLLVGPPARCREQLGAFREAGVEWATLGPQRVGEQDLLHQARLVASELAPC